MDYDKENIDPSKSAMHGKLVEWKVEQAMMMKRQSPPSRTPFALLTSPSQNTSPKPTNLVDKLVSPTDKLARDNAALKTKLREIQQVLGDAKRDLAARDAEVAKLLRTVEEKEKEIMDQRNEILFLRAVAAEPKPSESVEEVANGDVAPTSEDETIKTEKETQTADQQPEIEQLRQELADAKTELRDCYTLIDYYMEKNGEPSDEVSGDQPTKTDEVDQGEFEKFMKDTQVTQWELEIGKLRAALAEVVEENEKLHNSQSAKRVKE
ncbi:hypothetical protein HDU96_004317 [Phlyctochytrium bullatum]|nr:hypothetical protein HDU96_004317 [Phlyctochytrium bullatum]